MTIRAQTVVRDPSYERRFAHQAAAWEGGDAAAFAAHVAARLEEGQRKFGDRWGTLPFGVFLRELTEEAVDLAAWAALAEQAIASPRPLTGIDAEIVAGLMEVARCGARAHRVLQRLERFTPSTAARQRPGLPARPEPDELRTSRPRWRRLAVVRGWAS